MWKLALSYILIVLTAQAHAGTTLILCEEYLNAPKAAEAVLHKQIFDRPILYSAHEEGGLARAYDKLGLLTKLSEKQWQSLVLSLWVPRRPGVDALVVDLMRFDRYRLVRLKQFRLPDLNPTLWRPMFVGEHQATLPYEEVRAIPLPKSGLPSPLDYEFMGYQSDPDREGTRVFVSARHNRRDYTIAVQVGLDVPLDQIAGYAFPDALEDGQVVRVKTPTGDYFRINLLTFVTDKL